MHICVSLIITRSTCHESATASFTSSLLRKWADELGMARWQCQPGMASLQGCHFHSQGSWPVRLCSSHDTRLNGEQMASGVIDGRQETLQRPWL